MGIFYNRVITLIHNAGISQAQFCRNIKINHNTVKNWETRNPTMENLILVAQYFHVSTDYLMGLTDIRNNLPESKNHPAKQMELIHYLEDTNLTDKQSEALLNMIRGLKRSQK